LSGNSVRLAFAALAVLLLGAGCGDQLREAARERQCRANLNTLSTDQAMFRNNHGRWATTVEDLDQLAGRTLPLMCPSCLEPYRLALAGDDYLLQCPSGEHGSIQTGTPSWAPPAPVRRST
jgi:hypothetical protein